MGRFDEALAAARRAQDLDPLSLVIGSDFAALFRLLRRFDEAIEQSRKTLAMDPNFEMSHTQLGLAYSHKLMYPEAIAEFQTALKLQQGHWLPLACLGYTYAISGNRAEAHKILHDLTERSKRDYFPSLAIAWVYIGLEDKDQAFEWLGRAVEERGLLLLFLKINPLSDPPPL
jgi:tetratricopeptide (TPR) repeat protein